MLKPQDIMMLLRLHAHAGEEWSYRSLSAALLLSVSEVHEGLKRAASARLYNVHHKRPVRRALEELLIHGVKYVFPPERGGLTRGTPTGYPAPPVVHLLAPSGEDPPVWPRPDGTVRGYSFSPLYKTAPDAAAQDQRLYELLALVDVIRDGRARQTELAIRELKLRMGAAERTNK